ncbi:hypothetical protein AAG906_021190 [Vitis piasezkii]
MAEQIPFNIIADVLTKLGSSAIQQIGSAFGVAKELTKLTETLDAIRGVLLDAEEKQEKSHAVKTWVRRLKDVVYDADDLLDDFATHQLQRGGVARQVSDFFSSSNQLVFRFKMSNRLKNIKEEVDEIVKEIDLLKLVQGNIVHREVESSWRETHSFVLTSEIVGRVEDKEEIIKSLMSSDSEINLSVVAIVGIGGLGKTTLAQLVYNDKRVVEFFELQIWICVLNYFDEKILVKKILESLSGGVVGDLGLDVLKDLLHEKLGQKRYLLVLDDVWSGDFQIWDNLRTLLMVGAKGSRIIVTTQNSSVASTMGCNCSFTLKGLEENQCWNLFSKLAFRREQANVHPELEEIGKEIVKMCNGVPLVIKTLGAALQSKTEKSQWLSIKTNENLLSLRDGNDSVSSVLKLSYDNLPIHLKQCFAFCALFPKNYEIEKKLLIQLWMAQGYIQPLDENVGDQYFEELLSRSLLEEVENGAYNNVSNYEIEKNMLVQLWMAQGYIQPLDENVGHQYFEELLSRSLLEEFGKDDSNNILSCKMHDLIHDLAQLVIGSDALILEDDVKEISKEVHHISLFKSMNLKLKTLKVKHIRTFLSIITYKEYLFDSIQSRKFSSFKHLRVLSLNNFIVYKVPKSLGKLSHLRYLDLSYNAFEVLPNSITRLKNLQTLKLVGCYKLIKFPEDTRELINLRHLENDDCHALGHMPCGIGELTSLQSLPVFTVGNVRRAGRLSELKELNNLRGGLWIQGLENVRDVVLESREANLGEKQHIQSLRLNWRRSGAQSSEDVESVLEGLQSHRNLKKLCIEGYGGIRFPSWMMNGGLSSMLPNLTTVNLEGCSRCQTLPCFLDDLEKVEYMECSSEGPFFPSLENLNVNRMPKLKELWRRGLPTHPPPSLPCLSKLKIYFCDALASLELHSSPLLSQLEIVFCDELASLELHSSPLLSILEIHHCPKLTSLLLPQSPLLSRLDIRFCGDLASLELRSSPLLSSLKIFDCPKLTSVQASSLPCLKELKLMKVRDEVLRQSLLVTASSLESVSIERIDDLITLPDELHQHASTLQTLEIWICTRLATLPHWIGNLSSLTQLRICDCPKLTSLPEEMRSSLPSTYSNSLVVHTYSKDAKGTMVKIGPRLLIRCQRKMVKIGPRLLMSQTLVLIGYGSDAETSKAISMVWPSVVDCPDMKALPEKMRCEPTVYA